MRDFQELLSAAENTTQFLNRYVHGGRGFTSRDVWTGIHRLKGICEELEQTPAPSKDYGLVSAVKLTAARISMGRAKDRVEGVVRG